MPIEDTTNSYEYKLKAAGLAEPLSTYLSDPNDPDRLAAGFVGVKTNPLTGGATGLDVGGKQPFARSLQPNFVATRVLSGQANNFPTGGTNYTWSLQIAVPHDFVAVRLVLSSAVLADITGLTAAVSVGGTLSDRVNNAGTWTPALFNESATGTIPAATSGAEPNVVVTDWVPVESVPRADGGVNRLVYLRLNTNTTNPNLTINGFGSGGSGGIALWNNKSDGFTWCSRFQVGDFVASPSGMTAATEPQQTPIAGIQYMTRGPISNVLAFGDSITQCVQTTVPGDSWAYRALRDKGLPLGAFGWDGQSSAVYLARAKKVIPVLRPTHAFYPVFSPNDGILTATVMTAQVNRALQFAELCKQNECTPIFWTGLPRTTNASNTASFFTVAQDAFRKRVNKAFTDSGYFVADIGGALSDTTDMATASKWASTAYLTLDGIHPNDTGHEAMAAVVSPVLAKLA
jgi:lysophospholipase L1-like esterase